MKILSLTYMCLASAVVPSWLLTQEAATNPFNRVFHSLYKVGRHGIIVFKGINNSKKKLNPVGLDLVQEIITGLGVQCLTI